jgi:hypothetical protein
VSVVLEELELGGTPDPWERAGFRPSPDGTVALGATRLRFTGVEPAGIRAWALRGARTAGDIDGLPTRAIAPASRRAPPGEPAPLPPGEPGPAHPNGALRLDHLVVFTPDLERTFAALADAGLDLRRVREAGTPEHPVRQGFYRLGEPILEVVGDLEPPGPARFWGLVLVVADLDALAAAMGEGVGRVKAAVQPGRRIATARESAGFGLPVAFMTP